jgi:hypothetical protein
VSGFSGNNILNGVNCLGQAGVISLGLVFGLALLVTLFCVYGERSSAQRGRNRSEGAAKYGVMAILEDIRVSEFSDGSQRGTTTADLNVANACNRANVGQYSGFKLRLSANDSWRKKVGFWNRVAVHEESPPHAYIGRRGSSEILLNHYHERPRMNVLRVLVRGWVKKSHGFKQHVSALGQANRVALMIERAHRSNPGNESNASQDPIRPDRRFVSIHPSIQRRPSAQRGFFLFLCGAVAVGLGGLFAYRSKFVGEHPEIALVFLACYVCLIVGAIAWLG